MPRGATELHHEVELGIVIGTRAVDIPEANAMDYVGGYALALDMTDRAAQNRAKTAGLPWSHAKGFDTACPISPFITKDKIPDPQNVDLWLKVNGTVRQKANTKDMIFKIPFLISWISHHFTLEPGDLILTGTPPGVGPVKAGDTIQCGLGNLVTMSFPVQTK